MNLNPVVKTNNSSNPSIMNGSLCRTVRLQLANRKDLQSIQQNLKGFLTTYLNVIDFPFVTFSHLFLVGSANMASPESQYSFLGHYQHAFVHLFLLSVNNQPAAYALPVVLLPCKLCPLYYTGILLSQNTRRSILLLHFKQLIFIRFVMSASIVPSLQMIELYRKLASVMTVVCSLQ